MAGRDRKLIAFALYPGVTPLDIVGPLTVLRDLRVGSPYRTVVVGESLARVESDTPLGMVAARTFHDVPAPFALFVPGGGPATVEAMQDPALVDYVRSAARTARIVGSTGNGALILGAAGLLPGRRVAAHWAWAGMIEGFGAEWVAEPWVEDGPLLTAAGGSAGIDAMLHLTAKLRSRAAARLAQVWMEYDPQPPFGGIDRRTLDGDLGAQLRAGPAAGQVSGRASHAG